MIRQYANERPRAKRMATFGLASMARHRLAPDPDPDITVIAISSHVHELRLCWALNRATGLCLTRRRKDISDVINGHEASFATYDQVDPEYVVGVITLVHNHSSQGVLVAEQRGTDYFLLVDKDRAAAIPDLIDRIRSAQFVLGAFPVDLRQLRTGHKLLS